MTGWGTAQVTAATVASEAISAEGVEVEAVATITPVL